jgi:hypothetical protein
MPRGVEAALNETGVESVKVHFCSLLFVSNLNPPFALFRARWTKNVERNVNGSTLRETSQKVAPHGDKLFASGKVSSTSTGQ